MFTITNILLYTISIRGSIDIDSLVIKLRATNNYAYSNKVDVYSFL